MPHFARSFRGDVLACIIPSSLICDRDGYQKLLCVMPQRGQTPGQLEDERGPLFLRRHKTRSHNEVSRGRPPISLKPRRHIGNACLPTGKRPKTIKRERISVPYGFVFTPPEVANTGPGFNRGSGGGARGCGFEERVGVHARTGGIHFLWVFCVCVCPSVCTKVAL